MEALTESARIFSQLLARLDDAFSRSAQTTTTTTTSEPPRQVALGPFPTSLLLTTTLGTLAAYVVLRFVVFSPLAYVLFRLTESSDAAKTNANASRRAKFVAAGGEFALYFSGLVCGVALLSRVSWIWPSRAWWVGTPLSRLDEVEAFFYVWYAARYVALLIVVLVSPRKKDFGEMVAHHIVTACLVLLSYVGGLVKVGLVVMTLFDVADPLLHLAKMVNYLKEASPEHTTRRAILSTTADGIFASFALAFSISRIFVYGYVVYSCTIESFLEFSPSKTSVWEGIPYGGAPAVLCVVLVWILYGLQWFWFILLVDLVKRTLKGEDLKDNRSDEENELVPTAKKAD